MMNRAIVFFVFTFIIQSCSFQSIKNKTNTYINELGSIDFQTGFENDTLSLYIDSVNIFNDVINSEYSGGFTGVSITIYQGRNIPIFCVLTTKSNGKLIIPLSSLNLKEMFLRIKIKNNHFNEVLRVDFSKEKYLGISKIIISKKVVLHLMQKSDRFLYY